MFKPQQTSNKPHQGKKYPAGCMAQPLYKTQNLLS